MTQLKSSNKIRRAVAATSVMFSILFIFASAQAVDAATFNSIQSELSYGSRGAQVTNLQNFLASNSMIYPEGIVSGYYGTLTQRAVVQFQFQYGIPQVGRVGPMTLAKINSLILADRGLDISAPRMSAVQVSTTNTSATINWSTDESAVAKANYSTVPLQKSDVNINALTVSGIQVTPDMSLRASHAITLSNLAANTMYHYLVQSTDQAGNLNVSWNTFRTK